MRDFYELIAPFYDIFNKDVSHAAWADLAEKCFTRFEGRVESVLDLGTGTGSLALELARRGYDMIGVDASEEMLSVAHRRAEEAGLSERILWLCQKMTDFELYGTVEAVVSSLDCINHLLSPAQLRECFRLVHNYLVPNGLFLFDVNTPYKFEHVYGDRDYVLEEDGALCAWQNLYREKSGLCDFYISLFTEQRDGSYLREDTVERERRYTLRALKSALGETGFELLGVYGTTELDAPEENSGRWYLLAKAIKEG